MSVLVPAAVAAVAGTLWASSWTLGTIMTATVVLGASIAATALSGRDGDGARRCITVGAAFIIGAGGALGGARLAATALPFSDREIVSIAGTIVAGSGGSSPTARIRLETAHSAWLTGSASGEALLFLDEPPPPAGTAIVATRRGPVPTRDARGVLRLAAALEVSATDSSSTQGGVLGARARARMLIDQLAGSAAGLLRALVLGEADDVDPRTELLFRRAGAIHLLALSGMHLAVIALLVKACARPLVGRRAAGWLAVGFGALYVVIAGPRPGLVRAALLVAGGTALREIDRPLPLPELLAGTALVQLVVQPGVADSLAFQLSYLSLLGIAVVTPRLAALLSDWIPPRIASPLAAGIGAQLTTIPLLIARFGVWYPIGIVASVVMGPMVLVFMTVGIIALALALVGLPAAAMLVRPLLEFLAKLIEWAAWFFAGAPGVVPTKPGRVALLAAIVAGGVVLAIRIADRVGTHRSPLASQTGVPTAVAARATGAPTAAPLLEVVQ